MTAPSIDPERRLCNLSCMFAAHLAALLCAVLLLATPLRAETSRITLTQDGLTREYLLSVPDSLPARAPLVLALHGVLETAESMQLRVTRERLDVLAERYGFVVAYPSGWGRVWHLGEGDGAARLIPKRDDIAFLERVIADVQSRARIDPARIFATGYSMGGMMSLSLACKRPGLVRAVAVSSSNLPAMLLDDCRAAPPAGVAFMHGTDDDVVPYAAGHVISGPLARMQLVGVAPALAFFTAVKRCQGSPRTKTWDAKDDRTVVTRRGWYDCRTGAVEGYRIEGGGHRWPSGGPILPVTGQTTREIDGAAAVWGFFSRFK